MLIFFLKNACLSTKFNFPLKKKRKKLFRANFKITWKNFYCRHQKNTCHKISFFYKLVRYTEFLPKQEKFFFRKFDDIILANRMKPA